ncbi:MAG: TetR/AcrR family transcriptional regulator [Mycobacteriales bacterium]
MAKSAAGRTRLDRDAWIAAAGRALGDGGLAAISIDPLAKRLGATRGSFYWHFRSREDLIIAALERWEQVSTVDVIAAMEQITDPAERLTGLLRHVLQHPEGADIEISLLASARDPIVAPVLRRATERRIGYVEQLYRELGCSRAEARDRALLAYTAHVGLLEAEWATGGGLLPDGRTRRRYLSFLSELMRPPYVDAVDGR